MKSYLVVLLVALYMVSLPRESYSVLLCDGDCRNNPLEICQEVPKNKTLLNVMALFPCNVDGFRARGLTVAAQMAVQKIANEPNLLYGYKLKLQVDNTMCNQLAAIRAFINQLSLVRGELDQRYMIIGPGCSVGAITTAEVAPFYSLTQIGYTTTSVSLSNKRRFPNFLRAISSDNASIATVVALVKKFDWKQVAIVSVRDDLFSNLTSVQSAALVQEGVRVLQFPYESGTRNVTYSRLESIVDQLNTSGARIVLLNIYEDAARLIFCLAYRKGMIYPRYTFISHYWWSEFWWTDRTGSVCSVQELTDAIFMSLAVDHFPTPLEEEMNARTDVGYDSPGAFWTDFDRNLISLNYSRSEALRQAAFVYDAVWMAAFALNTTSTQLQNGAVQGANRLEQFNHFLNTTVAREINELILNAAQNSKFQGVSGKVKLNIFGDREPTRKVYQYLYTRVVDPNIDNNNDTPFAFVDSTGSVTFLGNHSIQTVFPEGVTEDTELVTINQVLFILYTIIACLGIIFAIVCMVFNIVFRNKRIVKLSSPYLNLLIISGAILYYVVVIMFGLDISFVDFTAVDIVRCQMSVWLASIGFSLLFGTMLAKTWRVYYIFKNIRLKKRPLKDWLLFLIVMVMVGVDVVFLIVVSVDSFRVRLQQQNLIDRPGGQVPLLDYECTSAASDIWIPILLVFKTLYLVVGVFLATQTYNVKLKRLRDSKLIVACVCTIGVVALVAAIVALSVNEPSVAYGVYGLCIASVVTVILFILFGTLMIELYQNPSGETDISTVGSVGNNYLDSTSKGNSDDQVKIDQLKQTIQSLKRDITEKKRQFENLLSPVNSDIHAGSNTNLLGDHVTPVHDYEDKDNGHTNSEKTNGESVDVVVNENSREYSPMNNEVEIIADTADISSETI